MNRTKKNKSDIHRRIELLEQQSELIKQEINEELNTTKKKALDLGKIALGIGGGILLSAIIVRSLSKSKNDDHQEQHPPRRVYHKFKDQLLHEFSNQAMAFFLGIAKDKINDYLDQGENVRKDDSANVE
jgi:tRNA A37 N6-isopentenylltransferase MiaA